MDTGPTSVIFPVVCGEQGTSSGLGSGYECRPFGLSFCSGPVRSRLAQARHWQKNLFLVIGTFLPGTPTVTECSPVTRCRRAHRGSSTGSTATAMAESRLRNIGLEGVVHRPEQKNRGNGSSSHRPVSSTIPVGKRRLLTVYGTADAVVPSSGGRGPGGTHLSAQQTAFAWPVIQGHDGAALPDSAGQPCGKNLLRYDYPAAAVTHIKVLNGRHGLVPALPAVQALIRERLLAIE